MVKCLIACVVVWCNGEWEFSRNRNNWQAVTVPHDWAIAGPFNPNTKGGSGKLPWCGVGTYRRDFILEGLRDSRKAGECWYLEFDGVMARPQVTVNGHSAGGWDYGYMSFVLDVTALLVSGSNRVEVVADTRHHHSRWYPGAGIYRDVRLVRRPREHVLPGTLKITTPQVSKSNALVRVEYESSVKGKVVRKFEIRNPRLWDVDDPYLYELNLFGERFRYGVRTFEWTVNDGFHLNGRRVQLKGVNLHSDLGPLGMAFDTDAMRRQLRIMRNMGVNAIRTSHNAPDPKVLDLCDEMGFLVWDECFDKWEGTSGRLDSEDLDAYVIRNLRQFVMRDRNHPSVVLWSIGNEINTMHGKKGEVRKECQSRERNAAFRAAIRELDDTRPVGNGNCFGNAIADGCLDPIDVIGWNYGAGYRSVRAKYPQKPCVCSESASAVSSNGHFEQPPAASKTDYDTVAKEVGGYDHNSAAWSDIADVEFARMEKDRYCCGEFVWTGFDYLGEPTPYDGSSKFPAIHALPNRELARSSYFGIVDLVGFPKDRYWLYRSHWNPDVSTVHILPHWNWPGREGNTTPVYVYTNGDSAELFLNGRSCGIRRKGQKGEPKANADAACQDAFRTNRYYEVCNRYRLRWLDVPYEPGELKAVAYKDGVPCGETVMRTAGAPTKVRLVDDPFNAPDAKTRFVLVDVADANGVRVPLATNRVSFALSGPGFLMAVGNGNPRAHESFTDVRSHPLYFGRAVAVVRRQGPGVIRLTASANGLEAAVLEMKNER